MKLKLSEIKIYEKITFYEGYRIRVCIIRFELDKSVAEHEVAFISRHQKGIPSYEICLN